MAAPIKSGSVSSSAADARAKQASKDNATNPFLSLPTEIHCQIFGELIDPGHDLDVAYLRGHGRHPNEWVWQLRRHGSDWSPGAAECLQALFRISLTSRQLHRDVQAEFWRSVFIHYYYLDHLCPADIRPSLRPESSIFTRVRCFTLDIGTLSNRTTIGSTQGYIELNADRSLNVTQWHNVPGSFMDDQAQKPRNTRKRRALQLMEADEAAKRAESGQRAVAQMEFVTEQVYSTAREDRRKLEDIVDLGAHWQRRECPFNDALWWH